MAGFMFFISGDDSEHVLETTLKQGVFSPYISNVKSAMVDALSDFYSMRPGDNIYFVANRKVYGVGQLKQVGEDCKYRNYLSADQLNMIRKLSPEDKPVIYDDPHYRWFCCFEPGDKFHKSGIDLEEALQCRSYVFKLSRTFDNARIIRFNDEDNQVLKDFINIKSRNDSEVFDYSEEFHNALRGLVGQDYLIDGRNVDNNTSDNDVDLIDYRKNPAEHFEQLSDVAKLLLKQATITYEGIEKALYSAPSFINVVKATVPENLYKMVLSDKQKEKLATGAAKIVTSKSGLILAKLRDPKTGHFIGDIPVIPVQMAPALTQALTSFSAQMILIQISEQIKTVQNAIEEIHAGQESDRLAMAYSCQQKLLQAMAIKNPELKQRALMQLISSAEDSRNLLMLSQKNNVHFVIDHQDDFFQTVLSGSKKEKRNKRMDEIQDSLCAVNMVSMAEAVAYQMLGEQEAARTSLTYFADFIDETYLARPGLIEKLDRIDLSREHYWTRNIPTISEKIRAIPEAVVVV